MSRQKNETKKRAPLKSTELSDGASNEKGGASDFLTPLDDPELVFGLVGPIGTDLKLVSNSLEQELLRVGYKTVHIHVTDAFQEIDGDFRLEVRPIENKYNSFMNAGNKLRERIKRQDAFALFAVSAIRGKRFELTGSREGYSKKTAYILNQLKRPEEIDTLRRVYGRNFIQISAYCSEDRRLDNLTKRIARSHYREKSIDTYRGKAQDLISRDNDEEENRYGQRIRDTFPLADVIISAESEDSVKETCSRFIRAFFGDNFCTPTIDEHGMYIAKAAALRSADLSRQVGAAIFSCSGEILSLGCNEVPRALGGAYWEGDPNDQRDFRIGEDSSVRVKREIVEDAFRRLRNSGWLAADKQEIEIEELAAQALGDDDRGILKDSQISNILEFGRIVHAEMLAITDAARRGIRLSGATLYCTTFPCHICARHIVASGIERVIYVEPYSKSLAAELYPDSIVVEGKNKLPGPKVIFLPFIGVAPQRYRDIFSKGKRKSRDGKALNWDQLKAKPILEIFFPDYMQSEVVVLEALGRMLKESGLRAK